MKELKLEELNEVKGGVPPYHGNEIYTLQPAEIGTGSMGTYVDGINMGTDCYQDAN